MKINNTEVIQSYILTTAKYDYSVYEKWILYRLVESLQNLIEGQKLTGKTDVKINLFGERDIKMPISIFLADEKDNNYERVKKALKDLRNKHFEYEDDEKWESISIIEIFYPNPTNSQAHVKYVINQGENAYLSIIPIYATSVVSNNYILDVNNNTKIVNLNNHSDGLYKIILVVDGQISDTKTLIKN